MAASRKITRQALTPAVREASIAEASSPLLTELFTEAFPAQNIVATLPQQIELGSFHRNPATQATTGTGILR